MGAISDSGSIGLESQSMGHEKPRLAAQQNANRGGIFDIMVVRLPGMLTMEFSAREFLIRHRSISGAYLPVNLK